MSTFRTLHKLVLAKVESTPGVDAIPTVGSNAIAVESPSFNPNLGSAATNEATGSLSPRAPLPNGGDAGIEFDVPLHGSGAAATAPEYGPLLRACGMSETILAADVTGTAQAGSATTITLAAGASAVDNFYLGMIIDTTGGTGSGQQAMIVGYVGSTKVATIIAKTASGQWGVTPDATTTYAIRANVQYRPISTGIPTLSFYLYELQAVSGNVLLQKILGAVGTWRLSMQPRGVPRLSFSFTGALQAPADVSAPSAATFQATRAEPWMNGELHIGAARSGANELSFDYGAPMAAVPDPNQPFGSAQALHAGLRGHTGRIVPPKTLVATRDPFTAWRNGTPQSLSTWWGSAAGKRVAILWPATYYTAADSQDVSGLNYQGISFTAAQQDLDVLPTFW